MKTEKDQTIKRERKREIDKQRITKSKEIGRLLVETKVKDRQRKKKRDVSKIGDRKIDEQTDGERQRQ